MVEPHASYKVTSAPAAEPVTNADVKEYLGIDASDTTWDSMLTDMATAARELCEAHLGMALITQTIQQFQDRLPGTRDEWFDGVREMPVTAIRGRPAPIILVRHPVQSVSSVKLYDEDDTATTVSADVYQVDLVSEPPRIAVRRDQAWPSVTLRAMNGVEVEYVAGYGSAASSVPDQIKRGIIMLAGYLFEHRGECDAQTAVAKSGALALWRSYRQGRF